MTGTEVDKLPTGSGSYFPYWFYFLLENQFVKGTGRSVDSKSLLLEERRPGAIHSDPRAFGPGIRMRPVEATEVEAARIADFLESPQAASTPLE